MLRLSFIYTLFGFLMVCACKGKPLNVGQSENLKDKGSFLASDKKKPVETSKVFHVKETPDSVFSDTIRAYHYQNNSWTDSVITKDYKAVFIVRVDTCDPIIDTMKSLKGKRIVIGYNHDYSLIFSKNNKPWFTVSFNKKKDLESLIGGTDFCLESNLDVFRRLVYKEKYQKFIIEYEINPLYNYGSVYYFVFDTHGKINYTGTAGSWGGGNPDGIPFITDDYTSYVTCYEVYNFKSNTAMALSDFASNAEYKTFGITPSGFKWLHGLRNLSKSNFLVVFNRNDSNPGYNALIINTDTLLINRFRYYGLMEERNAEFLFQSDTIGKKFYIYDTDRDKLISIDEKNPSIIKEYDENTMIRVNGDTMTAGKYTMINFEIFGSYRFYKTQNDTVFYCDIDKLE